jgi:hypothetical protein
MIRVRGGVGARSGEPVEIGFQQGRLVIDSDERDALDEVTATLTRRLFVEGKGFPVYQKDSAGGLARGPEGTHLITGYVDMSGDERAVLAAIGDAFRVSTDYFVEEV